MDARGGLCVDLGCSTGGFVSCWLHHGAREVYALDTGYGVLDFGLRRDGRVRVMERTNALHAAPADAVLRAGGARYVSVDLSWTPQHLALPAALGWLGGGGGRVVTLVKPHYEAGCPLWRERYGGALSDGVLAEDVASALTGEVLGWAERELGVRVEGVTRSPIVGGKSGRRRGRGGRRGGNAEYLALIARA